MAVHVDSSASSVDEKDPGQPRFISLQHNDLEKSDPAYTNANAASQPEAQDAGHDVENGATATQDLSPAGKPPGFDPRENPDGGREAWLCLIGGWCILFCSFGWINCIGVFQEYYQSNQLRAYSPSTVAWIPSLETFLMFFMGPWVGAIFDRYGPRWLLVGGTFLHVFGLMMTSLCTEYYQFILAQGICSPIGVSMIFFPATGCIPTWFLKRRAFAFGIMASGSSLGGVVLPIMVQRLILEIGFGWAMRTVAFLILGLMIVANFTLRSRMPPQKKPFVLREFIDPLKESVFDIYTFGSFTFFMGLFIPINYSIAEAISHGMSRGLAQYMLSILNAASLFGRILPGYFADKVGRFNVMILTCFLTAVLTLAMWLPSTTNGPIIAFNALYGFTSGAFVSMAPSCMAQISDVRKIGTRTGTYFALISIAALISNPIGGALIDRWGGRYTGLQIFAGVMMAGGSVFILLARVRLAGPNVKTKV